jgi:diguanylate cyclase (GGDEF)-like protein
VVEDLAERAQGVLAVDREGVSAVLAEVERSVKETAEALLVDVGSEEEIESARRQAQELLLQLSVACAGEALRAEKERDSAREEARHDALTGVLRRGALEAEIGQAFSGPRGRGLALLVFDLDFFKLVNDRHGHAAGDDVLRATARTIEASFPEGTTVGRYGGEEFLALLRDVSLDEAMEEAEDVRRAIEASAVETSGTTVRVTASGGLCWVAPSALADPASAFRAADAALYEAKRSGRNRVRCAKSLAEAEAPRTMPSKP